MNFAAIPVVDFSNATGFSLGVMGQFFYRIHEQDTISPTSTSGIFGMYTTNNTWFTAVFQKLVLQEDRRGIKGGVAMLLIK